MDDSQHSKIYSLYQRQVKPAHSDAIQVWLVYSRIVCRWEIYVSHHPAGTTYFFHPNETAPTPPIFGWIAAECAMQHEVPILTYSGSYTILESLNPPTVSSPSSSKQMPLRLWGNYTCPYVQRVRIALHEKALMDRTMPYPFFILSLQK